MTKTQFTDAVRNVQKQIIPWISIVVIGMVSLMAYLSLVYSGAAIERTVCSYYNTYNLWDMEISSTLMMDGEDLAALRAVPGVERAEPVWTAGAKLFFADTETSVTVQALPEEISLPQLMEGRLPEAAGECAIEQQLQKTLGLRSGDRLRLDNSAIAGIKPFRETEYVITGIFRHPDHISFELPEAPYLLVTRDSFNLEGLDGAFMKTRIRVADAPADRYSEAYRKTVQPVKDAVSALMEERMALREGKMRADYEQRLDEGQTKLDEGAAKLREAEQQIEDASRELEEGAEKLASARQQLDDGWVELKNAAEQLADAKQQLDEGGEVLYEAEAQIAAVEGLLYKAEAIIGYIDGIFDVDIEPFLPKIISKPLREARDGLHAYNDGRNLWYSKGEEYLDAVTRYEKGKKTLEQGEQEYLDGKAQYEQGKAEYEKGKADYEKGKAEYEDGERQLQDAREQMDKFGPGRWMVLNDDGNAGYIFAENQAEGLTSMSYSFSSLFLVIAALVIYASVGRMVQEQRAMIGTSKALGLYNREILAKYMFFGLSAAASAVTLGIGLTYSVVQRSMLANYEPFFVFESIARTFLPRETALVAVSLPLAAGISVWFACAGLIRIPAIRLLQGEQPGGRRRSSSRLSSKGLYTRLIFRNLQTDLRRVLVTIVSIAGCCALLVCGFMIKFAIERVNDRQFGQIVQFQAEVSFDPRVETAAERLTELLRESGQPFALVHKSDLAIRMDDSFSSATAIVAEPESLNGFYGLKDPKSGEILSPTEEGVLIPSRLSSYRGLNPGGTLSAYDSAFEPHELRIARVFNNHFRNLLFFTPSGYACALGAEAAPNCFLVRLEDMTLSQLEAKLDGVEGLRGVDDATADRARLERLSSVLNAAIFLLLGLAGVMAYFIVMNLSVTYIHQKTTELTIMRINGFTVRECVVYVSWDLIITTFLGILLGLMLGHYLGTRLLPVTEGPYMQFVHEPDLRTYLYSALITAGFSAAISSTALRRVKNLKLSDII